jgi:hypothetical protein
MTQLAHHTSLVFSFLLLAACGAQGTLKIYDHSSVDYDEEVIRWTVDQLWKDGLSSDLELHLHDPGDDMCPHKFGLWDGDWCNGQGYAMGNRASVRLVSSCMGDTVLVHELIHVWARDTGVDELGDPGHRTFIWLTEDPLKEKQRARDFHCGRD